ncbi:MAG: acyl-ACP--UDP-N-acetylglucosamine O-acyltransferase [Candidatus Eremiobacteraeota bacterium]|nr:acyl-ACP--UDP-N-acetylglucosamine O-acyltransferase [Candidatus Eremiobacteraeota bacterium]MBV8204308.1 acyl-ACP--UDP-N-acetylglucosamine O-acyltransferase [Candidatus Eremiobacteraeota bacterium]MBV8262867.1 acyl-ACP--UDP-N-acetylglucosamine O-acyltransferase [Candidatus Eremiobacteraeota bacterium]MBV8339982.1 acyl-ACP--UDP-N-acetylglucosamine O-acyltransferase [Candidatus Eremiobacteraeota bacterium]MBV8460275.1 acyl-ACP--UDP-N-acetylglucosamine O-acyltransferase [Candidatus Eremiobacter
MRQLKRDVVTAHASVSIHPLAVVHPAALLGRGVEIGPFCLIGEQVRIGDGTKLLSNVIINGQTSIGRENEIHPFAVLGGTSQDKKYRGEVSFVRIGDRNVIREYVTINRGTGAETETVIGDDNHLLAGVHIAHNCRIGNRVVMSNLASLAGHVIVGDNANIGGMVGVHQFVRIGRTAMIGGMSRVVKDIPPFMLVEGNPTSIYGLNTVGLKRINMTAETVAELKEAYRILYRSNLNLTSALEHLRDKLHTDEGRELIAFLQEETDRGVLKR